MQPEVPGPPIESGLVPKLNSPAILLETLSSLLECLFTQPRLLTGKECVAATILNFYSPSPSVMTLLLGPNSEAF